MIVAALIVSTIICIEAFFFLRLDKQTRGVLAIASEGPQPFYPDMGSHSLRRIGELCAAGVSARL